MWKYSDFISVSEEFIPAFSEEHDKGSRWKFFIPHEHMKSLLEKLIIALERGSPGDRRSLWLTGPYGTGKTHVSFVVKHLLEDPVDEIEDYFNKHDLITPLWPRFASLRRKGSYLVVYRSGSGDITSSRRLMIEVQQAIKKQLQAGGYGCTFGESIMDQLISRLTDQHSVINWEAVFKKYRGRFRTVSDSSEIITKLQAGDIKLAETVATVLEEEGITLLDSPAEVKEWLKQVIERNKLQGIVFLWDEFTDFFKMDVPVTPLQELAHATGEIPFYLFLVTHRSLNQFSRIDDDTRKKLLDRFHTSSLDMAPVTANRLLANAIDVNQSRILEWNDKKETLWKDINLSKQVFLIKVLGSQTLSDEMKKPIEQLKEEELKALVPIHPFTAYLLALISSQFSSSQRTVFRFLKENDEGSFQWFIRNYPQNGWCWLTPDFLWQYFFEDEEKLEDIEEIGDILSYYKANRNKLDEEELRVFRVLLLNTALWRQTRGVQTLLKPSLSIIKRYFAGTGLFTNIEKKAEAICLRGIMHAVPDQGNDFEYIIPTATVDRQKLDECRRLAESTLLFEKMIDRKNPLAEFAKELLGLFDFQGASRLRHPVQLVSAKELKQRKEKVLQCAEKPYQIGIVLVVAQEDEELYGLETLAEEITEEYQNYCILLSQNPFGKKRWQEWLDYKAWEWYHEAMKESTNKNYYNKKAKSLSEDWLKELRMGSTYAFFMGKKTKITIESAASYLQDIVDTVFSCGPEKISTIATLYNATYGKTGAEIGLGIARNVQSPYRDVVNNLSAIGLWKDGELTGRGNHPLNKMKEIVDSIFAGQEQINLKEIWQALQEPPYGLMPSPVGLLLFSRFLRDYANGYYYSDGFNSWALNPNKLAELVTQIVKGEKGADNYTIKRMSNEGERFCIMARETFGLSQEETSYPEESRKNMRRAVQNLGYPLWTLDYYAKEYLKNSVEDIMKTTKALSEILSFNQDRDELTDNVMKDILDMVGPIRNNLPKLLESKKMKKGMELFISKHGDRLVDLMSSLNLNISEIMDKLKKLLNEEIYLWEEERVKEKLPELEKELDLTDALNSVCGTSKQDLNDVREYFRRSYFRSKYPFLCYKEGQTAEMAELIDYLNKLIYQTDFRLMANRADDIRRLKNELSEILHSHIDVTVALAKKYVGIDLNEEEAASIYNELQNMSHLSMDEVSRAIRDAASKQARRRKLTELRDFWRRITDSDSPEDWSNKRRTPIYWVLKENDYSKFFEDYMKADRMTEQELDKMISFLADHQQELAVLKDDGYVLERFVDEAAGDYAQLVRETGKTYEVRDYVFEQLGDDVYRWMIRANQVNNAIQSWLRDNYGTKVYPRIAGAIDYMPAEEVKDFLKKLVAEDVLLGARLLEAIEKNQYKK